MTEKLKLVTLDETLFGEQAEEINYENSSLGWDILTENIYSRDHDGNESEIQGYKALRRGDTREDLAVIRNTYGVIPNKTLWETMENSLKDWKYKVINSGYIRGGRTVFVSVEVDQGASNMVGKDQFQDILMFSSSHDGSSALRVADISKRLTCANQVIMSLPKAQNIDFRVSHHSRAEDNRIKLVDLSKSINSLVDYRKINYGKLNQFAERPMSSEEALELLVGFELQGVPADLGKVSTRAKNRITDQHYLFSNGIETRGETYYDLFNATTEYYTHYSAKDAKMNFSRATFGAGAVKKTQIFNILSDQEKSLDFIKSGRRLIKDYELEF